MIGKTLNHYRILSRIGAGGMGEVYEAEDLKLKRRVALKILPPELAADHERRVRFEREAQAVAALNHPNIVTIHSVEQTPSTSSAQANESVHFLTMELIEGRPISSLIVSDGLPLDKLFAIAIPLADALAAAHQQGITHRDLKPGNVMVTRDDRVKVLDFGLAKLAGGTDVDETQTATMTREGQVVGSVAYMSPEQAEGKTVDARTDVFAMGVMIHEMATGRRPFGGHSPAAILSSLLRDDPPPVTDLKPTLPKQLTRIIRSCLEKDPDRRMQTALDVRNQLEDLKNELASEAPPSAGHAPATEPQTKRVRFGRVGVVVLFVIAIVAIYFIYQAVEDRIGRARESAAALGATTRQLAQLTTGAGIEEWPAWSPDGSRIAYAVETAGFMKLFVKNLASGEVEQLTRGPKDDIQPEWSLDGSAILFVRSSRDDGKLQPGDVLSGEYMSGDIWRIDVESGEELRILENAFHPAVSPAGDRIAFDASWAGPRRIWVTDSRGRNPEQVTTDVSEAVTHTQPRWSSDGSKIVYQYAERTRFDIKVVDPASKVATWVTHDGFNDLGPVWSPSGRYIYFSSYRGGGLNIWRIPVSPAGEASGAPQQLTTGAGQDVQPALTADGARLAFVVLQQNADVWKLPVSPTTGEPTGPPVAVVATTREDSRGAWSPDGTAIAFNSDRDGEMNIWVRSLADGSETRLTSGPGGDYQSNWSPDGASIVFFSARDGNADIWSVDVVDRTLTQLTNDPSLDINPFYSPDGRHVAFQSDRDGRLELWVMNADGTDQRQLATIGASGHFMRWSDDGKDVIFRSGGSNQSFHRVAVEGGSPEPIHTWGGAHISFSPNRNLAMDVTGHTSLEVAPVDSGEPRVVFEFDDPDTRIDYPVWSPDGMWVLFDRVAPQGGDIWLLEGFE